MNEFTLHGTNILEGQILENNIYMYNITPQVVVIQLFKLSKLLPPGILNDVCLEC